MSDKTNANDVPMASDVNSGQVGDDAASSDDRQAMFDNNLAAFKEKLPGVYFVQPGVVAVAVVLQAVARACE